MTRRDAQQGKKPASEKPSVPLEKLIEQSPHAPDTEAADRLASEAAKAPEPAVETPDRTCTAPSDSAPRDSILDLVENDRRRDS